MVANDIKNIEAEAGVIASVIMKPELVFYSEQLRPNYFTNTQNAYIYYAVTELVKRGVEKVDAYNIMNLLDTKKGTSHVSENLSSILSVQSLQDLFNNAGLIARDSPEDYRVIVASVMEAAFRRNTFDKLQECMRLCANQEAVDIEKKIYTTLDDVMMDFSSTDDVPEYGDMVDTYWDEIESRQSPEMAGIIPFHIPELNNYVQIERGELIIFGAEQKMGKSMLLLNIARHLIESGLKVLYLDSEINSRQFTCRMISHLTGIPYKRVRNGQYSSDEHERIMCAKEWLKNQHFTHKYLPVFDVQTVYTLVQKVYHQRGIDVLIIDYFKSTGEKEAYATYAQMGELVDTVKNKICGDMNIAGVGAAQATSTGKLADSAKIARNASTIILIEPKTEDDIIKDGVECGNRKLVVKFNRNGEQMTDSDYIDLQFDGNVVSYEQAEKQHAHESPF